MDLKKRKTSANESCLEEQKPAHSSPLPSPVVVHDDLYDYHDATNSETDANKMDESDHCDCCRKMYSKVRTLQQAFEKIEQDIKESNAVIEELSKSFLAPCTESEITGVIVDIAKSEQRVQTPKYSTVGSSGADLYANIDTSLIVERGKIAKVPTGVVLEIPHGFEMQMRTRSSMACKGLFVVNSPGTIDSDYRGEIHVILANLSDEPYTVNPMDRIAQLVLSKVYRACFSHVNKDDMSATTRGDGGFGHTGK